MKLSENIQTLLEDYGERPLPLGKLLEQTGQQGFGLLSGLLALPLLIPLPIPLVGFSTLLGSGILLMGLQLVVGFRQPYLPGLIARLELSPAASQKLLKNLTRVLCPLERFAQTRLVTLSRYCFWRRVLGLCLVWNAFLLSLPLPIPFSNLLPAYSILFLSIGLVESDGFFILMGYGMTATTTFFFTSIASAIWAFLRVN